MKLEEKRKLEIALSNYLPHGLKMHEEGGSIGKLIGLMQGRIFIDCSSNEPYWQSISATFKPILHPLSDLTKEIEHNGEKFVPIDKASWGMKYDSKIQFEGIEEKLYMIAHHRKDMSVAYQDFLFLFEYHFDVFGLIEENLAININNLK